jgi:heme/copper-type cytochrome/quinol oxidase subunit 3
MPGPTIFLLTILFSSASLTLGIAAYLGRRRLVLSRSRQVLLVVLAGLLFVIAVASALLVVKVTLTSP